MSVGTELQNQDKDADNSKMSTELTQHTNPSFSNKDNPEKVAGRRKTGGLTKTAMIWIRRIHLFSGLFMLPWVLLYGFTALLFNHSTLLTDSKTTIEHFRLQDEQLSELPDAGALALLAVEAAQEKLSDSSLQFEMDSNANAHFTRQAFGTIENDQVSTSVIVDLNTGVGYLRNKTKRQESGKDGAKKEKVAEKPPVLGDGLKLSLGTDAKQAMQKSLKGLLSDTDLKSEQLKFRSIPTFEFDAVYDSRPVRMRFSQPRSRGGKDSDSADKLTGELTIFGSKPREMSMRSFLLRWHVAIPFKPIPVGSGQSRLI